MMINFTLYIDTLKMQVDFINNNEQREVMNSLTTALLTSYPFLIVKYSTSPDTKGSLTHSVYTGRAKILELTSGAYKDMHKRTIYFITIEIAGLKQYNTNDKIANDCLSRLAAYLNSNGINFRYTGIDLAIDMQYPFAFTYAFCNKKAPRVSYYQVYENQPYLTTHYVEKYNNTHNRVMKRSYLYDKNIKEEGMTYHLTRFELKLQTNFFNKYYYEPGMLQGELDRYHILCFATLEEKETVLSLYASHESTMRRRDLYKMGLDRYRMFPNTY